MPASYLEQVQAPDQRVNNLFRTLGVQVEGVAPDRAELAMTAHEDLLQGAGVLAGGVLATLLDEAMAHVVLANLGQGEHTATVELSVRYLRPVAAGDRLRAVAKVLKPGRRVFSVEAWVERQDGGVAAKAAASFLVVRGGEP
jgi:uncharacterized protein (TIGR00369 family)